MENKKEGNNLDNFIRKLLKTTLVEYPSSDFTEKVMAQLPKTIVSKEVFQYRPLISRRGWIISGIVIGLSFILLISSMDEFSLNEFGFLNIDLRINHFNWFSRLSEMLNSEAVKISVLIFTGYLMLEIFVLKNLLNKRRL